jgi:hypothetical protein
MCSIQGFGVMRKPTGTAATRASDVKASTVSGCQLQFVKAFICGRAGSPEPWGQGIVLAGYGDTSAPELLEARVELGVGSRLELLLLSSGIFTPSKMGVNVPRLVKTFIFLLVSVENIVPKDMHGGKLAARSAAVRLS